MIATISGSRVFKAAIINFKDLFLTLDRDDQLGNNWENLSTALLQHVKNTLYSQESVWILLLTDTLKENREVVVVVKLLNFNFPVDLQLGAVLDSNREISSVVEATEFRRCNWSHIESSSLRFLRNGLFFGLIKTNNFATETLSLFQGC